MLIILLFHFKIQLKLDYLIKKKNNENKKENEKSIIDNTESKKKDVVPEK